MGVRNCGELGLNLQKIYSRLLSNDNLINLLFYTDEDPLAREPLTATQKQNLFNDLVCMVPDVGSREDSKSVIAIYVPKAQRLGNKEFKQTNIIIDVFVPLTHWIIKDSNLRPFAIMGEIQNSLDEKSVNGLGKMEGGDFELFLLTNEMSGYRVFYSITEYD